MHAPANGYGNRGDSSKSLRFIDLIFFSSFLFYVINGRECEQDCIVVADSLHDFQLIIVMYAVAVHIKNRCWIDKRIDLNERKMAQHIAEYKYANHLIDRIQSRREMVSPICLTQFCRSTQ